MLAWNTQRAAQGPIWRPAEEVLYTRPIFSSLPIVRFRLEWLSITTRLGPDNGVALGPLKAPENKGIWMRTVLAIGAAIALAYPTLSHATGAVHHHSSHRICYAKIGDEPSHKCNQLLYMKNFPIGGESIIAKTDLGDFSLSGKKVDSNTLAISGVYVRHPLKGKGKCILTMSAAGRLSKADCTVRTETGLAILRSTGDDPNDAVLELGPIHH